MGNLVRACLGRDYSVLHFQRRRKLALNLWIMCKVLCAAVFDAPPRNTNAEDNNAAADAAAAARNHPRAAAMSPSNLLKLLYKRHVLKSQSDTQQALSRCSEETTCKFCSKDNDDDNNNKDLQEKKETADLSQSKALEILYRLNSEVQRLTSKLDREGDEVKKLKDEISSLRSLQVLSQSQSQSSRTHSRTPSLDGSQSNGCDSSTSYHEFCLTNGGHLVKLENVYMFQPGTVVSKPRNPHCCDDEAPQGLRASHQNVPVPVPVSVPVPIPVPNGSFNVPNSDVHGSGIDVHSPRKVGAKCSLREHSLGEGLRPLKVQSNARRSVECKCSPTPPPHYDRESQWGQESPTRTEIEMDELDNLSNCSFESADTRDFEVGTAKAGLKRDRPQEEFPEQMDWSSEESSGMALDHSIHREKILPWTPTDPEIVASRRQVQQRYQELEEKLLKILQSPRREILPQLWSSNSSSCSSSESSTPRSTTGSVVSSGLGLGLGMGEGNANAVPLSPGGSGGGVGLFWEPSRKKECTKTREDLCVDKRFDSDLDFASVKSHIVPLKVQTLPHPSPSADFCVGKFDPKIPLHRRGTRQGERVVTIAPDLTRHVSINDSARSESPSLFLQQQTYGIAGEPPREPDGSSLAVDLWDNDANEPDSDIEEVSLETYKVYKSGDIYRHDHRSRNRHDREDSSLYRETQGSNSSGTNHLKRNLSFAGQGTRQTRFGLEAARLSLTQRKHGLQRRGSF